MGIDGYSHVPMIPIRARSINRAASDDPAHTIILRSNYPHFTKRGPKGALFKAWNLP
jgi:hypothetical protein